jgi:hypothetical protein
VGQGPTFFTDLYISGQDSQCISGVHTYRGSHLLSGAAWRLGRLGVGLLPTLIGTAAVSEPVGTVPLPTVAVAWTQRFSGHLTMVALGIVMIPLGQLSRDQSATLKQSVTIQ